ncbi:MAG TPA: hypothetical protein V6D20_21055 [Candidatus Obscuribacterales bacterium]
MLLLARDGIFQSTPYLELEYIKMQQANRADVAIRCDGLSAADNADLRLALKPSGQGPYKGSPQLAQGKNLLVG